MSVAAICAPTARRVSIKPMERTIYQVDASFEITAYSARNSHKDAVISGGGNDAVHSDHGGSRSRGSKVLVIEEDR